ncbi:hypothetical protein ABH15_01455 [Methanoculleus taiwanensis]|uniref:UPF0391 membrane protein ABH15_01455 n=2 Tax=Methanoculleus taiwanensis TaxID=1550565 RepID=A0A498H4C9_9EURY|nr:hypothetical protein ABH15_01455 [Methanoculleus taiwanensis]
MEPFAEACGIFIISRKFKYPLPDTGNSHSAIRRVGRGEEMVNGLLGLAILFFILALVFAVLGARGIAGISMSIAKWLVIIFIVLAIIALLL